MAKKNGLDGLVSLQWDIDSGESERTPEATAVWEKLLKTNSKVSKITSEKFGEEDVDYMMS